MLLLPWSPPLHPLHSGRRDPSVIRSCQYSDQNPVVASLELCKLLTRNSKFLYDQPWLPLQSHFLPSSLHPLSSGFLASLLFHDIQRPCHCHPLDVITLSHTAQLVSVFTQALSQIHTVLLWTPGPLPLFATPRVLLPVSTERCCHLVCRDSYWHIVCRAGT